MKRFVDEVAKNELKKLVDDVNGCNKKIQVHVDKCVKGCENC